MNGHEHPNKTDSRLPKKKTSSTKVHGLQLTHSTDLRTSQHIGPMQQTRSYQNGLIRRSQLNA